MAGQTCLEISIGINGRNNFINGCRSASHRQGQCIRATVVADVQCAWLKDDIKGIPIRPGSRNQKEFIVCSFRIDKAAGNHAIVGRQTCSHTGAGRRGKPYHGAQFAIAKCGETVPFLAFTWQQGVAGGIQGAVAVQIGIKELIRTSNTGIHQKTTGTGDCPVGEDGIAGCWHIHILVVAVDDINLTGILFSSTKLTVHLGSAKQQIMDTITVKVDGRRLGQAAEIIILTLTVQGQIGLGQGYALALTKINSGKILKYVDRAHLIFAENLVGLVCI